MSHQDQFDGKVAVITGAGSGIGAALARHAASLGMHVIAADIDKDGLEVLMESIGDAEGSVTIRVLDVSQSREVDSLAEDIFDRFHQVNLLFNNAGVLVDGKSWTRSEHDWRWCFEVNVMGVVHGIKSFVPRMLLQNAPGRIVNTASIGGLLSGAAFLGPYQMSKHAVVAITETLHQELSLETDLIKASVLCPGEVNTGIWESDRLREAEQHTLRETPSEQMFHQYVSESCKVGLTPDEFAPRAFAEIAKGKFWLLPQPEFKALYQKRVDSILEETNPPGMEELPEN